MGTQKSIREPVNRQDVLFLFVMIAPLLIFTIALFILSGLTQFTDITQWFDPVFFQYNLLLFLISTYIVPFVTYFYIINVKGEKVRRLKRELSPIQWAENEYYIMDMIDRQFRFRHYLGSMTVLVLIITVGVAIILLLKPYFPQGLKPPYPPGSGVNYGRGANFLLLGPYMEAFLLNDKVYLRKLIESLTAFMFGFLGAYIYFIGDLIRSYFTLDLTAHTFVANSIRMVTSSILALVLSFIFQELPGAKLVMSSDAGFFNWLPVLSFGIGFFPSRGLLLLEKLSSRFFSASSERYSSTSLSNLTGMSYAHEVRLQREGYDNLENIAHAKPLELVLRTGFSYHQLRQWIGEAWLWSHMGGADYKKFRDATGLITDDELCEFLTSWKKHERPEDPCDYLDKVTKDQLSAKIRIITQLLQERKAER